MKRCNQCGSENVDQAKFCKICGASLPEGAPERKFCPNCGHALKDGAQFCSSCGKQISGQASRNKIHLEDKVEPLPKKDKTLYFIFGIIGIVLAIGVAVGVFSLFGSGSDDKNTVNEPAKIESQQNENPSSDTTEEDKNANAAETPQENTQNNTNNAIVDGNDNAQNEDAETVSTARENPYQERINEQFERYYSNQDRTYSQMNNDYTEADNLLNEIYQRIKDHMISSGQVSEDKFNKTQLVQEEREWIEKRDAAAEAANSDWDATDEKIYFTLMRCQELLDNYDVE